MAFADGDEEWERERERKSEESADVEEGDQTGIIYVREGVERGAAAWRFHYGDVSLRQTYAPNVVPALAVYISRYFIFIRPA